MLQYLLMKRNIFYICIFLLSVVSLSAQTNQSAAKHKLRVTVAAGYSWDMEPDVIAGKAEAAITSSMGIKPMVGFGYRLQYGHFLFDAGADVAYRYVNDKYLPIKTTNKVDFGEPYLWDVTAEHNNRHLHCQHLSVGLPVAIGFTAGYVYGTIGAKLGVNMANRDGLTYLYTEVRDNVMIANPIVYYRDDARGYGVEDPLGVDVLLTAELGARLDKIYGNRGYRKHNDPRHHYLALFAEVGVYGTGIALEHVERMPFTVGVKYTLEIDTKEKYPCMTCDLVQKGGAR